MKQPNSAHATVGTCMIISKIRCQCSYLKLYVRSVFLFCPSQYPTAFLHPHRRRAYRTHFSHISTRVSVKASSIHASTSQSSGVSRIDLNYHCCCHTALKVHVQSLQTISTCTGNRMMKCFNAINKACNSCKIYRRRFFGYPVKIQM